MTFEELVKNISPTLKRITYKLNGHFSFFNDEDLYQEALVHLWQDFQEGKLMDKTDSYILQGCYFHLKNYIRKNYDKASVVSLDCLANNEEGEDFKLNELLFVENSKDSLDYLNSKILVEEIQNNGLTKKEKEVLRLCMEDLTVREIAKRLNISHVRVIKIKANIKRKSDYLLDSNKNEKLSTQVNSSKAHRGVVRR